jgi:hypothetical protein
MAVRYLGDNSPDGTVFGTGTSELIGFYGLTTPIAQPVVTAVTTATATTALNETRLNRLEAALVALNLIRTTS